MKCPLVVAELAGASRSGWLGGRETLVAGRSFVRTEGSSRAQSAPSVVSNSNNAGQRWPTRSLAHLLRPSYKWPPSALGGLHGDSDARLGSSRDVMATLIVSRRLGALCGRVESIRALAGAVGGGGGRQLRPLCLCHLLSAGWPGQRWCSSSDPFTMRPAASRPPLDR